MTNTINLRHLIVAVTLVLLTSHGRILAHMAWLATDNQGKAIFWFGESPSDRTYHLPDKVASIKIHKLGSEAPITMERVGNDNFVGLRSDSVIAENEEIFGEVVYGLYHGTKLTYHVEHLPHRNPKRWPNLAREDATLQTLITDRPEGGVRVTVVRNGVPVPGATVKLQGGDGEGETQGSTDAAGSVIVSSNELSPGLNAVIVGIQSENDIGSINGEAYKSSADYLTASFYYPGNRSADQEQAKQANRPELEDSSHVTVKPSGLPNLPEELTSFGAAIAGNHLYVYGGHTGDAHSYSSKEQSNRLWSLALNEEDASWGNASSDDRLQGLALVAWNDRLIRVGGFTAVNEVGEDHDLHSQSRVAMFDPVLSTWTDLAELPEARSSLDAAVLAGTLYVFGGWDLSGDGNHSQWHQSACSLDLADPNAVWQALPQPPFQRRAVSVAAFDRKLFVIGGMQSKGGPTTRVDIYDPQAENWSIGPSLPGQGMSGFGSSAFAVGGSLYVSTLDGFIHRLDSGAESWTTVAKVEPARFFHRMIPFRNDLLLIGGANMQIGKFTNIDLVKLSVDD